MCLASIVSNAVLPKGEVYGWKIFNTHGTKYLYFPFYSPTMGDRRSIRFNRWLTADPKPVNFTDSLGDYQTYLTGFHVFRRRKDARAYKLGEGRILKVRIKQIRLLGLQDGYDCYIADKILVLGEKSRLKKGKTSNGKRKETKRK